VLRSLAIRIEMRATGRLHFVFSVRKGPFRLYPDGASLFFPLGLCRGRACPPLLYFFSRRCLNVGWFFVFLKLAGLFLFPITTFHPRIKYNTRVHSDNFQVSTRVPHGSNADFTAFAPSDRCIACSWFACQSNRQFPSFTNTRPNRNPTGPRPAAL